MNKPLTITTINTQGLGVDQVGVRKQTHLKRIFDRADPPPDYPNPGALAKRRPLLTKNTSPTIQRRSETMESSHSIDNRLPL